jgi:hypothetical protein
MTDLNVSSCRSRLKCKAMESPDGVLPLGICRTIIMVTIFCISQLKVQYQLCCRTTNIMLNIDVFYKKLFATL